MKTIDLNADVGEGGDDLALIPLVTSVNIACGGHAGDEATMERALLAARDCGVAVGAHPGYADRENFGRKAAAMAPADVTRLVEDQVRTLAAIAARHGIRLRHVKPHGALYNQAATDRTLADAVAAAVRNVDPGLRLVGLAGSQSLEAARAAGLRAVAEGFCDRRYRSDGTLVPRSEPGAVLTGPSEAAAQAIAIARGEPVATADGKTIVIRAETLCIHGDMPGAVSLARAVREGLIASRIELRAL